MATSSKSTAKKKKSKSRVNEAGNYTKPALRKRLFKRTKQPVVDTKTKPSKKGLIDILI